MDNITIYSVYVKTDERGNITEVNSSAFLSDTSAWTKVGEGFDDKYHHAQGNYLEKGIVDSDGCYNYQYINGAIVERTSDDKQAELVSRQPALLSTDEKIELSEARSLTNAFELIMEMLGGV